MRHRALIMAVVWSVCWLVWGCESEPEFTDPGARLEYRIRKKLGNNFDELVYDATKFKRTAAKIHRENKLLLNPRDLLIVDFMHPALPN